MFKKTKMVIVTSEADAYKMMRLANNHNLYSAYKIGVYGPDRQHEVIVTGQLWHFPGFLRELSGKKKK